jgi:hypothetical protein
MNGIRISFLALLCGVTLAGGPLQKVAGTSAGAPSPKHVLPAAPPQVCDQQTIDELTHRVRKLELQALEKNEPPKDRTIIVAIIAAAATIIVAIIAWMGERKRTASAAQRALGLARAEALWR